jgi:hypothetical protein
MKNEISIPWWQRIFPGWKKAECLRLLQCQRMLLHTGMEATAEIMDTFCFDERIGGLMPVKLWIKLRRSDGTYIYTHSSTVVAFNKIPGKGDCIKIKYLPENLAAILIL